MSMSPFSALFRIKISSFALHQFNSVPLKGFVDKISFHEGVPAVVFDESGSQSSSV